MYKLIKKQGNARRGEFQTVHGTVQTPAFMNVGTSAAIKGGISSYDLKDLKCQCTTTPTSNGSTNTSAAIQPHGTPTR